MNITSLNIIKTNTKKLRRICHTLETCRYNIGSVDNKTIQHILLDNINAIFEITEVLEKVQNTPATNN